MTVKALKKIVSTSTTIVIHIASSEENAINEESSWSPHYTFSKSEDYYYDKLKVVYIHPVDKEELDVWVLG